MHVSQQVALVNLVEISLLTATLETGKRQSVYCQCSFWRMLIAIKKTVSSRLQRQPLGVRRLNLDTIGLCTEPRLNPLKLYVGIRQAGATRFPHLSCAFVPRHEVHTVTDIENPAP